MGQIAKIERPFAQRERFRFMEATLLWEGSIQRARVSDVFGVAANHVTKDLRDYERSYPRSLVFDPRLRTYVPGPLFAPRYASDDPAEYLGLQLAYAESGSSAVLPLLSGGSAVPSMALPSPAHGITRLVLQQVIHAIRRGQGIELVYHSLRSDKPSRRTIWPHALVHTGVRWCARAWDAQSGEFRHFVLQRMDGPRTVLDASPTPASKDADWQTMATLEVVPHPALNPHQQKVIAREYGMRSNKGGQVWPVRLRRCLIGYFVHRYGLDVVAPKPPQHVIVLRNAKALRPWFLPSAQN
jgi:hypothetical protein